MIRATMNVLTGIAVAALFTAYMAGAWQLGWMAESLVCPPRLSVNQTVKIQDRIEAEQ